ncbi:MAG: response regulator [Planctomycetes bacterium]|nr:response regulator [Planctomycetota bacterium]
MADRILIVDDAREVLASFERLLGRSFDVVTASSGERALELCREQGPFAVVVADYEMPGMKGIELLMRVREHWPHTVPIMITGVVDVDVAIDALHNGRIFRFLEKPCPPGLLTTAIEDALAEHRRIAREHELANTLRFSRETLARFNQTLNGLIDEQTEALLRLNRFVSDLNAADSLQEIGELAARAARDLVGDRAVSVEICSRPGGGVECRSMLGPAASGEQRREPAHSPDGEIGCIRVDEHDSAGRPMSSLQASLLAAIAGSTAVAAHNQVRRRERDEAQHATILALAKLAEQRDNETGKHLERVSLYCTLIAEGLREDGCYRDVITDGFVRDIYRCAPLHDIGKVGIPDAILLKPGKLTPDEWVVMKTHTEIGAETLRTVMEHNGTQSFLRMSLDIAWCHHEYWNGLGYPRGLAGEAIPLSARILALADVYDALTTVRVYKSAWTHQAALDWIRKESGTHFDPLCVASFVKREQLADQIRARLADSRDEVLAHLGVSGASSHAA